MSPINISQIEQRARLLRAAEMQRMSAQLGKRLRVSGGLLVERTRAGLVALGRALHLQSSRIPHGVGHKVASGH